MSARDTVVRVIEFDDGARLIVEVEDHVGSTPAAVAEMLDLAGATRALPKGAEPVTKTKSVSKAAALLESQISGLAALARSAVASARPSEIEIQAHLKFTGGIEAIPFLASAGGEGGLKLTLKWGTESSGPQQVDPESWENAKST
jgi:hypothetical protein